MPKHTPPSDIEQINKTCGTLKATLHRARPSVARSSLVPMLVFLLRRWQLTRLRLGWDFTVSIEKLAKAGGCKERQAQSNMKKLKDRNIMIPVAGEEGGNQPTTYIMDMEALHRFLVDEDCNPSKYFRPALMWRSDLEGGPYRGAVRGAVNDLPNMTLRGAVSNPIFHENQALALNLPDESGSPVDTGAVRGAVNTGISSENQLDSGNQPPSLYILPSYSEPSRGRISSSDTFALLPAVHPAVAKKDAENKQGPTLPPDLDGDNRTYLKVIGETGGATYGHVATVSGMGGTRAILAEEELLRRGLIVRAPFGKTVIR